MSYAIAVFKENGKPLKRVVTTAAIKDFDVACPAALDKTKLYEVKWEKSYADADGFRHDGYYPAHILLIAATVEELRFRAKEDGIRMPINMPLVSLPSSKQSPVKKSRKRVTRSAVADQLSAKKKRMEKTKQSIVSRKSPTKLFNVEDLESLDGDLGENSETKELTPGKTSTPIKKVQNFNESAGGDDVTLPADRSTSFLSLDDDEDEDDAAVLLDKLKKEHVGCGLKIEMLMEEKEEANEKIVELKRQLSESKSELERLRQEMNMELSESLKDLQEIQMINLQLQRQIFRMEKQRDAAGSPAREDKFLSSRSGSNEGNRASGDNTKDKSRENKFDRGSSKSKTPPVYAGSPAGEDEFLSSSSGLNEGNRASGDNTKDKSRENKFDRGSSKSKTPVYAGSPAREDKFLSSHSGANEGKGASNEQGDNYEDGYQSAEESIVQRIADDLTNKKPLSRKSLPNGSVLVYVGSGVHMNEKMWEKVRKSKEDSCFYKDCVHGVWGREKLKTRTAMKKTPGKTLATPKKVDLVQAMLVGRLRSRGASDVEVKFTKEKTSKWLGQKFYDVTRPPKESKKND
ncbi:hypothetical protein ONE63_009602 [Megalurothrips usitatus]|uniref:Uncharacterized protein n=1 Tax=Megalurothrips usitatus TaxID=439358 RepID=A0AAV7XRP9_9NEOP|nr:hypothetical protein ONE63_009602 [Megalurothrips usitatus]